MDITPFLKLMAEKEASDLFFSVGAPPNIKIKGATLPLSEKLLQPGEVKKAPIRLLVMPSRQNLKARWS